MPYIKEWELKSIEDQIRDKKAELKAKSRELSALQNELKKKNEALKIIAIEMQSGSDLGDTNIRHVIRVYANKKLDYTAVRSAIESLSETSEPKSYVDWGKIPEGYDWVAIDRVNKHPWAYRETGEAIINDNESWKHVSGVGGVNSVSMSDVIGPLPAWDKSLIHRPGAKE